MLFSIVIPTSNRNDLLSNCLTLLAPGMQTIDFYNYEVIVTDDSIGNVAEQLIKEKFSWATWIAGPKQGPAANRNNAANSSKGDWLVFLDDDCLPKSDIIEKYRELINRNPAIQVFEGWIERVGEMKSPIEYAPWNSHTNGGYLLSCNFAIQRDAFNEINGFDENFKYPHLEDYDFRDRIVERNRTILFAVEAKVVHPWRKIGSGWHLGKYEEMSVYYNSKKGIKSDLFTFLKFITGRHLDVVKVFLKQSFFSIDNFTALKIMLQHQVVVILNFNRWKRKYEKQVFKSMKDY